MGMVGNEWIEVKVPSAPKTTTANTWIELHLPNTKTLGRYLVWGLGRITFSVGLFTLYGVTATLKLGIVTCQAIDGGIKKLLKVYDALPYGGTPLTQVIEASAVKVDEPLEIITDIITAIEGKQVMIIGEPGTGKSTLAQYLAYTVGGGVKVYEPEGTPDDWKGLEVIGKGEDWSAIDAGMSADLDDLSNQLKIRNEKGDAALVGTDREMKAATMRGSTTIPQLLPNNPIQPNSGGEQSPEALLEADSSDLFSQNGRLLWRMIQRYGEGKSDSQVVTEVMGFTGRRYDKGVVLAYLAC